MTKKQVTMVLASSNMHTTPFCPTIADCNLWFNLLNHLMFEGTLPKFRKITVRRLRSTFAWCEGMETPIRHRKYTLLVMNNKFKSFGAFYAILAHEMVHSHEFHERNVIAHGPYFYSHKEMLREYGIKLAATY